MMSSEGVPAATRSIADVDAELTAKGGPFEMETLDIAGRVTRTWKQAPANLAVVLDEGRRRGGEADFIVYEGERLTHAEHFRKVATLAHAMKDKFGVQPGDRVAIAMRNYPEWSIAFFAATAIGAIAVALNGWWTGEELAFGLDDSESKVLIADDERFERLAAHPPSRPIGTVISVRMAEPPAGAVRIEDLLAGETFSELPAVATSPDASAVLFYTSGTTSRPKGAPCTHRNLISNLVSLQFSMARAALREGRQPSTHAPGVRMLPVPLFHATGTVVLLNGAYMGGKVVVMRRWDPQDALRLIEREKVAQLSGVPTVIWDVLNAPNFKDFDLSSLTSLGAGGAITPPEVVRRVGELLPGRGFSNGYGLTESAAMVTGIAGADYRRRPNSVGAPVPVCDLRIVDEAGKDLAPREPGEIWIRGPNVIPGYWRRPAETAATFADGWLRSGDVGYLDEEGFLYIVDRVKDIIIRGGENISSSEVEAALFEHPAVLEAAVIGAPHEKLGEEVGAVVRLQPGAQLSAAALKAHVLERIAAFKAPTRYWFRDKEFPRNASGKIMKRELKAEALASPETAQAA
jgi:long-chain acyl-CoA synthetase